MNTPAGRGPTKWRHTEIDRIDRQLADHWTDTVLAAVHQDDPLAFGLDRLRHAREVLAGRQGERAELDIGAVDDALARDRAARITAVATGAAAPQHLTALLGPVPSSATARDTWCGLAYQLEARLDRGLRMLNVADRGGISLSDRLANHGSSDPLDHPRTLIAASQAIANRPGGWTWPRVPIGG